MSATQTQTTPAHIIIWEGKPFNNEVYEREIQSLKDYAEQEKFDLESQCRTLYGIPVEWVSRDQRSALFSQVMNHRAERLAATYHYHRCGECKEVSACTDKDCKKTEIECRICHEGMSAHQWTMYHRKGAQEGWL
jgi:hypothetical protein